MSAKVVLKMHQTINGFACTTTGDDGWAFPHMDESVLKREVQRLWEAGVHIMGRNLYETMASYWPSSNELPAAPMNENLTGKF
jgi:hypothetical protein